MVETDEALESKYLTAELVKNLAIKKFVVVEEGSYEDVTYDGETSRRLTVVVEVNGRFKQWRPNRDSISNLRDAYGKDTKTWIGKAVSLKLIKIKGKDSIIASADTTEATV